ncbi:uncharacterized protein V1510DRAFT_363593 [Dipodascopsis tothii]|uniref:uncharacterized protein n=1 Tax=Dipodascopsis tothii TaxID=44089 RepID=UPI0034CE895D
MAGKKNVENSKKAAGNARKADAAAAKQAAADQRSEEADAAEWSKGSKSNAKKADAEAKKADAARKKAEREALLAEEMAALPTKPKGGPAKVRGQDKVAGKRANKIDDFLSNKDDVGLSASGIDDALDALDISTGKGGNVGVERHPERRFKAAYAAYEERRLPQLKEEHKGLRLNQMKDLIRKEFERSEENPFNQVSVAHNATRADIAATKAQVRQATENRLGAK